MEDKIAAGQDYGGKMFSTRALIGAAFLLAGCSQQAQQSNDTPNTAVENDIIEDAQESNDDTGRVSADAWSVTDGVDRITDDRTIQATQRFAGSVNDIDVVVTCRPGKPQVVYELTGFKKDGEGATMPQRSAGYSIYNEVTYRIDDQPARQFMNGNPQYSNQTRIMDRGNDWSGTNSAQGSVLALRVQFLNANETYVVDQTTPAFRSAVQPCLQAKEEYVQKQQEQEQFEASERAASEQQRKQTEANLPKFDLSAYANENAEPEYYRAQ